MVRLRARHSGLPNSVVRVLEPGDPGDGALSSGFRSPLVQTPKAVIRAGKPRAPGGCARTIELRNHGVRAKELSGPGSDLAPPGKYLPVAKMAAGWGAFGEDGR